MANDPQETYEFLSRTYRIVKLVALASVSIAGLLVSSAALVAACGAKVQGEPKADPPVVVESQPVTLVYWPTGSLPPAFKPVQTFTVALVTNMVPSITSFQ